jgi:hypothetical protein
VLNVVHTRCRHRSNNGNASHEPTRPPGVTLGRFETASVGDDMVSSEDTNHPDASVQASFFPGMPIVLDPGSAFPNHQTPSKLSVQPFRPTFLWTSVIWQVEQSALGNDCPKMTPNLLKAKTSPTCSMPHNLASSKHFCASHKLIFGVDKQKVRKDCVRVLWLFGPPVPPVHTHTRNVSSAGFRLFQPARVPCVWVRNCWSS